MVLADHRTAKKKTCRASAGLYSRFVARLAPGWARPREATMSNGLCSRFPPPVGWSENRQTHPAIAQAIFAVSSEERAPEIIWEMPTWAEWRRISELVAEYVDDGDFAFDSGRFAWGPFETLRLWPTRLVQRPCRCLYR